ncbi:MFS transporter [Streptomyces sp. TR1341]|uniref:MFS family permease n=1 Tax=Streptomyces murinus TaxID=33900 RepID=A0A7W3NKE3_STRMR|nr:MFS transporter [Streptomyces murinus]MBA9052128.1 MFS family permease [Streptomyces murinus]NDK23447.1 MFS transporter [Streptomyces sp. TR1341]UWW93391.1 MFS transporter [Streptomyces murinus]
MTTTDPRNSPSPTTGPKDRPPLVSRPLLLRFVSVFGASASFYLLLSVVPLYAKHSGAGGNGAGATTGALMLATVAGEIVAPRFIERFGHRVTLGAGLLLMGVPSLVLTMFSGVAWITVVCLLRGAGFALTVVAGGALTASFIPSERRGEGLALVGIVSGVPSLLGLPLGVWLVSEVGYAPVGVAAGVCALAPILSIPGLPEKEYIAGRRIGIMDGIRDRAIARPAVLFAVTALAAGIVVTFLPLAVPSASTGLVAVALFVQPAGAAVARLVAGRLGDRKGSSRLVFPGLAVSAAGMFITAYTSSAVAVVVGVAVFGIGFGIAQNSTITLMYSRVPASGYGTVSALWNIAYDAGMGIGAVCFGVLAQQVGYPWGFVCTAALIVLALPSAWRDRPGARGQKVEEAAV